MEEIILILYNIRSLYNVGSIFRTADAAGVSKIYLSGFTPAPVDKFNKIRQKLAKVSLGAEKYVAWDDSVRLPQKVVKLIKSLKKDGYKIFAIEQSKKSIPYYKIKKNKKQKIVLILGNELKGLPVSILKQVDKILEIPMKGFVVKQKNHPVYQGKGKESLNVSVAFAIVIFHLKYN